MGVFQGTEYYRNVSILLNDEKTFNEDLNNDNQIGDTIKSVKYDGSRKMMIFQFIKRLLEHIFLTIQC